jgi:hypothetical protein
MDSLANFSFLIHLANFSFLIHLANFVFYYFITILERCFYAFNFVFEPDKN